MNEIQKPNDIFVATLSSPNATLKDLLANNINANNTSFLTPEEYKDTPLVKKAFLNKETNTFNEDAFNKAYYNAYLKFVELTDEESYKNLEKDLEYSPNDRFRPLDAKIQNPTANIRKLNNPLQQQYSVLGVNYISEPTLTPEEAAQSNNIYDPETGSFINDSPESLPFYKKVFGDTLIYAKWNEDGTHVDPISGEQVQHHKGDWKTDEEGKYYTEYLGNRELGENQVVNLQDILTDEGSMMNKADFFDSDGYDKSAWGIAFKTMATIAPYMIPGVSGPWMVAATGLNLLSVLPTYYKAIKTMIAGDSASNEYSTRLENWFRKFEPSKSYKGKEGLFTLEGVSSMLADTLGQLYQQRTAASMAKYFMKDAPKLEDYGNDVIKYGKALEDYSKKSNKLQTALNLGYMGLISTNDVYNDALNAGYDKHTAGITALASAGALYGIMNFNETTRGVSSWFLKDMLEGNAIISRGIVRKVAKDVMKEMQEGVSQLGKGDNKGVLNATKTYINKLRSYLDDVYRVNAEGVIKDAIKEGTEEVSEEVVQDTIKGLIDTLSWLGVTPQQGSFGGWDNVFSAEGAKRYLETAVGGAFGGAVFNIHQNKVMPLLDGTAKRKIDYDLTKAIADGRVLDVLDEMKNVKKYFNEHLSTRLGTTADGKSIYATKNGNEMSQADMIYNEAVRYVNAQHSILTKGIDYGKYNISFLDAIQETANVLGENEFYKKAYKDPFENKIGEITELLKKIEELESKESITSNDQNSLKDLKNLLKIKGEELSYWIDGDGFFDYTKLGLLLTTRVNNDNLYNKLHGLSIDSYAYSTEGITDLEKLRTSENEEDVKLYNKIKSNYDLLQQDLTESSENLIEQLKLGVELLDKINPTISKRIKDFINTENKEVFLRAYDTYIKSRSDNKEQYENLTLTNLLAFIENNPKFWGLSQRINMKLAEELENKKLIDLSEFNDLEKTIVRQLINERAAYSRINIWDRKNLNTLIKDIQGDIERNDKRDPYIKKLLELQLTEGEEKVININKNILNNINEAAVVDPDIQGIKLQAILNLIESGDSIVDLQLYNILNTSLLNILLDNINNVILLNKDYIQDAIESLQNIAPEIVKLGDLDAKYYLENVELLKQYKQLIENGEGSEDLIPIFDEIISTIEKPVILSLELNKKWNQAKKKTVTRNPLLDVITDLMGKVGYTDLDRITWLYNKAAGIQLGTVFELTDMDKNMIADMISTIDTIESAAMCMSPRTGALKDSMFNIEYSYSYNQAVRQHAFLYGKTDQDLNEFYPVYSMDEIDPLYKTTAQLKEQLKYMLHLKSAMDSKTTAEDTARKFVFYNSLSDKLKGTLVIKDAEGNLLASFDILKPDTAVDVNAPEKEKRKIIESALLGLYEAINEGIKNKTFTTEQVVNAILEKFNVTKGSLVDLADINELITKLSVDSRIIALYVLMNVATSPTEIEERFIKGMEGKSLIPKFDQEFGVKLIISRLRNPEWFNKITTERYYNAIMLPGGSGTGKTTMAQVIIDALDEDKPVLVAPTETKLKDFNAAGKSGADKKLTSELLGNYTDSDLEVVTLLEQLMNPQTESVDCVYNDLVKSVKDKAEPQIIIREFTLSNGKKIQISLAGQKSQNGIDINRILIDGKNIEETSIIKSFEGLKNKLVITDEATYLSPFLLFINSLISKHLGARFVYLGDACQSGFDIKVGVGDDAPIYKSNISGEPIIKAPGLVGFLRGQNTAKTANQNYLHDVANDYKTNYDPTINTKNILSKYSKGSLIYKDLYGDRIVNEENTFIETLLSIKDNLQNKTIVYIVETDADKEALKTKLVSIGLPTSNATFKTPEDLLKTPKEVQGGEFDFSIIYNLKGTPKNEQGFLQNGDVDSAKIYTVTTRSKLFSLIYEPSENGLYSIYGITSKESADVLLTQPLSNAKAKNDEYMKENNEILEHLKSLTTKPVIKKGTIVLETPEKTEDQELGSDSGTDTDVETDKKNGGNPLQLEKPAAREGTKITYTVTDDLPNEIANEEKLLQLIDDYIKKQGWNPNEEESQKIAKEKVEDRIKKFKEALGDDTIKLYTYYIRLGIPIKIKDNEGNEIDTLKIIKECTSQSQLLGIMDQLYNNADDVNKKKDLLGYYKSLNNVLPSTGEQFLLDFILFRNNLIYLNTSGDLFVSIKKYDSNTDYAYLKPNDDPSKRENGDLLITTAIKVGEAIITIGSVGYNKVNSYGETYSDSLRKAKLDFIQNGALINEKFYKVELKDNINLRRLKYNEVIVLQDGVRNTEGINATFIIPITKVLDFKIKNSSGITSTGIELSRRQYLQITVAELELLGYKIEFKTYSSKEEYKNDLNNTRTYPIEDEVYDPTNKIFVKLTPKTNSNLAPSKIFVVNKVDFEKTVFAALSTKKNSDNLTEYALRQQLLAYFKYLFKVDVSIPSSYAELNDLDTHELLKLWIELVLIPAIELSNYSNKEALIKDFNNLIKALPTDGLILKPQLVTYPEIYKHITDDTSKGFTFLFIKPDSSFSSEDKNNWVCWNTVESYKGIIPLSSLTPFDILKNTTIESVKVKETGNNQNEVMNYDKKYDNFITDLQKTANPDDILNLIVTFDEDNKLSEAFKAAYECEPNWANITDLDIDTIINYFNIPAMKNNWVELNKPEEERGELTKC